MRLASKGKSLADSSYDSEVKSILAFLSMQHPAPAPVINPESLDIQPEHYLAPRFMRRIRGKVSIFHLHYVYHGFVSVYLESLLRSSFYQTYAGWYYKVVRFIPFRLSLTILHDKINFRSFCCGFSKRKKKICKLIDMWCRLGIWESLK